jgi:hypothetical protein
MEYPDPVCRAHLMQKSSLQRRLSAKAPGNPTLWAQILQAQILSDSGLLSNWLHLPQGTGIHVENRASYSDILCRGS